MNSGIYGLSCFHGVEKEISLTHAFVYFKLKIIF